jgi:hypothetical protein
MSVLPVRKRPTRREAHGEWGDIDADGPARRAAAPALVSAPPRAPAAVSAPAAPPADARRAAATRRGQRPAPPADARRAAATRRATLTDRASTSARRSAARTPLGEVVVFTVCLR